MAQDPINDPERLDALQRSGLLRHDERERFDILCETAASLLSVPIAQLNVLNADEQISVGAYPCDTMRRLRVQDTNCQVTIRAAEPVIVENTLLHPIMCISPLTQVLGVRSYLGVPVFFDEEPVGAFCVADYKVREWGGWDVIGLQGLARLAGLAVDR